MNLAFPRFRSVLCFAVLVALMIASLPGQGSGGSRRESEVCERWPQNRLILGDVQGRHFTLEAQGPVREMPPLITAEQRNIFHRTFSLSLDIAEPIALFEFGRPEDFGDRAGPAEDPAVEGAGFLRRPRPAIARRYKTSTRR